MVRIVCECGAEISRPLPKNCPRCGAVITSIRRAWWRGVGGLALAILMFAGLLAYLMWLVRRI